MMLVLGLGLTPPRSKAQQVLRVQHAVLKGPLRAYLGQQAWSETLMRDPNSCGEPTSSRVIDPRRDFLARFRDALSDNGEVLLTFDHKTHCYDERWPRKRHYRVGRGRPGLSVMQAVGNNLFY